MVGCDGTERIDLRKENFSIRDNGIPITNFSLDKMNFNYVFIFDCSSAMSGVKLQQSKDCAKALVDLFEQSTCTA